MFKGLTFFPAPLGVGVGVGQSQEAVDGVACAPAVVGRGRGLWRRMRDDGGGVAEGLVAMRG